MYVGSYAYITRVRPADGQFLEMSRLHPLFAHKFNNQTLSTHALTFFVSSPTYFSYSFLKVMMNNMFLPKLNKQA